MKFSLKEWSRIYHQVHAMGKLLKDSLPTVGRRGKAVAAVAPLTEEMQKNLEQHIKILMKKKCSYMDSCGMKIPPPLWVYDKDDKGTWYSEPEFRYRHLFEPTSKKCKTSQE